MLENDVKKNGFQMLSEEEINIVSGGSDNHCSDVVGSGDPEDPYANCVFDTNMFNPFA